MNDRSTIVNGDAIIRAYVDLAELLKEEHGNV